MVSLSTVEAFKHLETTEDMVSLVGERLLALQGVLFDMLVEVTDYFDANGIEYTLSGGTCLGAVRHNGFIPWDDDIDLNVPRSSYEKMRETFDECLGQRYWLHTPEDTSGYGMGLARIRKKGTTMRNRDDFGIPAGQCGVYLDVFIVENVPDLAALRYAHGIGSLAIGFALSCRRFAQFGDQFLTLVPHDTELRNVFSAKQRIGRLVSFLPLDRWCRLWNSWNSLCGNEGSSFVSIPAGRKHYFGELYKRADFFPVTMGVFEGKPMKLPANPDAYLRAIHGDYMTIPSVEDREAHVVFELDLGIGA